MLILTQIKLGAVVPAVDPAVLSRLMDIHVQRRRLTFLLEEVRDLGIPTPRLERMLEDLRIEATELLARLEVERHRKVEA